MIRGQTINLLIMTFLMEMSPNLSTAKNESFDLLLGLNLELILIMSSIAKNAMEMTITLKIRQFRFRERMTQKGL